MSLPAARSLAPICLLFVVSAAATASPALDPVEVKRADERRYADDHRTFQAVPGVAITAGGRLWATWYSGGGGEGPENYVVLATSSDGGRTWSRPIQVIDPESPVRAYDPALWVAPDQTLWWFHAQAYGTWDGRAGVWAVTTQTSEDPQPHWSSPRRIADGIMLNKPVVARNGRWLFPIARWALKPSAGMPGSRRPPIPNPFLAWDPDAAGSHVYASDDSGRTFLRLGTARLPEVRYDEHHVLERRDHSLWLLARATNGIAETTSADGGLSWAPGKLSPITNAPSRFFIRRLASGNLLLVKHHPPGEPLSAVVKQVPASWRQRSHLTAHLSEDDGATWKGGLLLDERLVVSYPDGDQGADGALYIIYDHNRETDREILLARFTEAEVAAGLLSNPSSHLRLLVNRATGPRP